MSGAFLEIQTQTGWGRVLQMFAGWCGVQPGWLALDVGCGPGLLVDELARRGARAAGVDLDLDALAAGRRYFAQPGALPAGSSSAGGSPEGSSPEGSSPLGSVPALAQADAPRLPFAAGQFDLLTAVNVLFLLPDPPGALREMARLLCPGGLLALLNPSERMSVAAAAALADARGLAGLERQSLLDWAGRAEAHARWDEAALRALLAEAGLRLLRTELKTGPGLARLACAVRQDPAD
ncbi:MAG: class I SAM-dependent methyltransferase [Chloroflexota bacterium]